MRTRSLSTLAALGALLAIATPNLALASPWTTPVRVTWVEARDDGSVLIRTTHNGSVSGQTGDLNFRCSDPDLTKACLAVAMTALTTQRDIVIDYTAQTYGGYTCSYTTSGQCIVKKIRVE